MNLTPIIQELTTYVVEKGARPIEVRYDQEDNNLLCFAPYDEADKAHVISLQKKERGAEDSVDYLFDLLRLADHVESTRIFDMATGLLSYDAILVYGLYGLVTGQRVLHKLMELGLSGDQWGPLVEPYHKHKKLFMKKNNISAELKAHWDIIVAHAYADSMTALAVAKLPSARQAVKAMDANKGNADGKDLGRQIADLLLDFEDSREWVESTFLKVMALVKMDGLLEIREAATGKVLQAPRQSFMG